MNHGADIGTLAIDGEMHEEFGCRSCRPFDQLPAEIAYHQVVILQISLVTTCASAHQPIFADSRADVTGERGVEPGLPQFSAVMDNVATCYFPAS